MSKLQVICQGFQVIGVAGVLKGNIRADCVMMSPQFQFVILDHYIIQLYLVAPLEYPIHFTDAVAIG
jgi:hypothetical protein